jgi:hypothetical protein
MNDDRIEFGLPAIEGQLGAVYTGEIFDLSAIGRSFDRQKKGYCTALVDARPFLFARRINTFVKN